MWLLTDNKAKVITLVLDTICLLLSRSNAEVAKNQTMLLKRGIHQLVLAIALGQLNAPKIRIKALYTLGDMIQSHPESLTLFTRATVTVTDKPLPVLMRLPLFHFF